MAQLLRLNVNVLYIHIHFHTIRMQRRWELTLLNFFYFLNLSSFVFVLWIQCSNFCISSPDHGGFEVLFYFKQQRQPLHLSGFPGMDQVRLLFTLKHCGLQSWLTGCQGIEISRSYCTHQVHFKASVVGAK